MSTNTQKGEYIIMARPKKSRRICSMPSIIQYGPQKPKADVVHITYDEYEVIRLIDQIGLSQVECSKQMEIARSTVATIYDSARNKLANALVKGVGMRIEGGDVEVCPSHGKCCGRCGTNRCGLCMHGTCKKCMYNNDGVAVCEQSPYYIKNIIS